MKLNYYLRGLGIGIAVTAVIMGFAVRSGKADMTDEEVIARAQALGMVKEEQVLIKPTGEEAPKAETGNSKKEEAITIEPVAADEKSAEEAPATDIAQDDAKKAEEEAAKKKAEEEAAKKKAEEEAAKKKAEEEAAKKKAEEEAAKKKAEEEAAKKKAEEEAAKKKAEEEAAKKKAEEEAAKKNAVSKATGTVNIVVTPGSGSETISNQLYKAGLVESATSFNAYLCSGGYDRKLTTGNHSVPAGASYEEIAKIMTSSR